MHECVSVEGCKSCGSTLQTLSIFCRLKINVLHAVQHNIIANHFSGVIALPTQTMHYYEQNWANHSKFPYLCNSFPPPKKGNLMIPVFFLEFNVLLLAFFCECCEWHSVFFGKEHGRPFGIIGVKRPALASRGRRVSWVSSRC